MNEFILGVVLIFSIVLGGYVAQCLMIMVNQKERITTIRRNSVSSTVRNLLLEDFKNEYRKNILLSKAYREYKSQYPNGTYQGFISWLEGTQ